MFVTVFPMGWYPYLVIWFAFWLAIPPYHKKDFKRNIQFGLIGTLLGIVVEVLALIFGLWEYSGGNWPIILWPAYFIASMVWHEIYRFFDSWQKKKQ